MSDYAPTRKELADNSALLKFISKRLTQSAKDELAEAIGLSRGLREAAKYVEDLSNITEEKK